MTLSRHCFVRLAIGAPFNADTPDRDLLAAWLTNERLAIVRARQPGDDAALLSFGVAFPNRDGRKRIALQAAQTDIETIVGQLPLSALMQTAPSPWRAHLSELSAGADAAGLRVTVYGSLAWQHLTGHEYLRASSDLDVSIGVRSLDDAAVAVRLLSGFEGKAPFRIDGELCGPNNDAVSWREYAGDSDTVLMKSSAGAQLRTRGELIGSAVAV